MINFIVCDDIDIYVKDICNIIDKVMITNDVEYKIYRFNDYNNDFMNILNKDLSFKIYILDIETPTRSGIEVARIIRDNDIESMMIFLTAYFDKYLKELIKSRFMFLDIIDKGDNYQSNLESTIKYALSNINKKNIIRFKDKNILYTIETKDIIYIIRNKDRKCLIKTSYNIITVNKTLVELYEMLDDRFIYSHRSAIVNKERIRIYDKKNKLILFDDGSNINLVSTKFNKNY